MAGPQVLGPFAEWVRAASVGDESFAVGAEDFGGVAVEVVEVVELDHEGCRNASLLFRDVRDQGFTGDRSTVNAYVWQLKLGTGFAVGKVS